MLCGCKATRRCKLCDPTYEPDAALTHLVCAKCGEFDSVSNECKDCKPMEFLSITNGVFHELSGSITNFNPVDPAIIIMKEFVTPSEEVEILGSMDLHPWVASQSGRMKQDYGPVVNFKKKQLGLRSFNGLPAFAQTLINKFSTIPGAPLDDFRAVELCNLDYAPETRGSCIDYHFDDFWVWGDRLVTLNLGADAILSFRMPQTPSSETSNDAASIPTTIGVPMPRRSLIIVQGAARHQWQHAVMGKHIKGERRVACTLRELPASWGRDGVMEEEAKALWALGQKFDGVPRVNHLSAEEAKAGG